MTKNQALRNALGNLLAEMEEVVAGEGCDHPVGICWCDTFRIMQDAAVLLPDDLLTEAGRDAKKRRIQDRVREVDPVIADADEALEVARDRDAIKWWLFSREKS